MAEQQGVLNGSQSPEELLAIYRQISPIFVSQDATAFQLMTIDQRFELLYYMLRHMSNVIAHLAGFTHADILPTPPSKGN